MGKIGKPKKFVFVRERLWNRMWQVFNKMLFLSFKGGKKNIFLVVALGQRGAVRVRLYKQLNELLQKLSSWVIIYSSLIPLSNH